MGFFDLFSSDFKKAIPAMAKENGWQVAEVDDTRAVLQFDTGGRLQTLYVLKYPNTLEFSVPSAAIYASIDDIPDGLAAAFLRRNSEMRQGFWSLEELDNKWVFSMMYNEALDRLRADKFGQIVNDLVEECDRFERGA